MISYLSKPIASGVESYKENVGLIAQVANQKQNRYDNILSTIFQKQNQLLSLDTSQGSEEAEQRKDNLLKEADNQLNKFASSDLTIPDNISKVENIFSPIINDKDVMGAASITAFTKEQATYFDEWKKEGKGLYDAKNEAYFLEQVQKNRKMTLQEVKEKGYKQPTSVEFVDIDAWFDKSVKELLPDVTSVVSPDGFGRIFYQNGKKLSKNDILQMLPTNTKIIAQAEINAHYTLQDVKPTELLSIQQKSLLQEQASVKALVDDSEKQVGYLKDQIEEIQKNSIDGQKLVANSNMTSVQLIQELKDKVKEYNDIKTQYEKNYKEYDSKINDFNATYEFNNGTFNKQLSEDELKNLKTSTWLNNKKQQFASAMAYEEKSIKIEYDQIQMEAIKHRYGLEDKYIDHVYDKELEDYKNSLDPKKNGSLTIDTDGDGIPDAGTTDILNAFGTTSSDANQEVLKLEEGKEYKQLAQQFGKFATLEEKLPERVINSISIYEQNYSQEKLEQDEENVLKILKQFEDPNVKGTDKIPGGEQTYEAFFKEAKTKELLSYIVEKDGIKNVRTANQGMLASIQSQSHEKAKSLLNNQSLKSNLKVDKIAKYGEIQTVNIPAFLSDKYLQGTLTNKDYDKIFSFNPQFTWGEESVVKSIVESGTVQGSNFQRYKEVFEQSKNEFAKQYAQGYKLPGLYIKDPETAKSIGKAISTDIRQYIKSNLTLDSKYANKDIEVRKIYRDENSPSGWTAEFNAFGTTMDSQGATVKQQPISDKQYLSVKQVQDYKLNMISDVTEMEKNLNQQKMGNPYKNPEFSYNYLGKNYKFVMDKNTGITTLLESTGKNTFKPLQAGNINNLIEAIHTQAALKFNK